MVLKQLVLTKRSSADGALVGEVGWLQGLPVVLGHVVQEFPLIDLETSDELGCSLIAKCQFTFPQTGHRPLS